MEEKITLQKIFDAAWQAFIVEHRPPSVVYNSAQNRYVPVYVSGENSRCAIGLVLTDDCAIKFRNYNFHFLVERCPELFAEDVRTLSPSGFMEIQGGLHDHLYSPRIGKWVVPWDDRKLKYIELAIKFKLLVPMEKIL